MAVQPSDILAIPANFVLSANLLRVNAVPSSRSLSKILNV